MFDLLDARGHGYLIKVKMRKLAQLLSQQHWAPIRHRPGWEQCERDLTKSITIASTMHFSAIAELGFDRLVRASAYKFLTQQKDSPTVRNISKGWGIEPPGWVKRSGPTNNAAIGGSVAALLDPPNEIAPGY